MKNTVYILILIILGSCSEIIPEIKPLDNNPVTSDKIYMHNWQNDNTIKIADDGTPWVLGYFGYYSLIDNQITKYATTGYNSAEFGVYKSGIFFANNSNYNNPILCNIQNNKLTNYKSPYDLSGYNYYVSYLDIDSTMCLIGTSYDNYQTITIFTFNEKEWNNHRMKSIPRNDYHNTIFDSRYNYVYETNLNANLVVYNPFLDKEVEFTFNVESNDGLDLKFSPNGIDKNGNIYAYIEAGRYEIFDFNSGTNSTKTFSIPGFEYTTFIEFFIDDNDELWYFGFDNLNFDNLFAYNITTNSLVMFEDIYESHYWDYSIYIDKNQIFWINAGENNTTRIWAFENGNQIENLTLNGTQPAFDKKDDNDGNFWYGVWNSDYNYKELYMFCYKNGEIKRFDEYFFYK